MPDRTMFDDNLKYKYDGLSEDDLFDDAEDEELWGLLSLYADGEANAEEAARVEAMLRSDPAYAREFTFLKAASGAVQDLPEVEPPAHLREAVFAATTRRETVRQRVFAFWTSLRAKVTPDIGRFAVPVGAFAAAALVAVVVIPRLYQAPPGQHPGVPLVAMSEPNAQLSDPLATPFVETITPRLSLHAAAPAMRAAMPPQMSHSSSFTENSSHGPRTTEPRSSSLIPIAMGPRSNGSRTPHPQLGPIGPRLPVKPGPTIVQNPSSNYPGLPTTPPRYGPDREITSASRTDEQPLNAVKDVTPVMPEGPGTENKKVASAPKTASTASGPHVNRQYASNLPPDSEFVTGAEIARNLDRRNLGYTPDKLRAVARGEATLSLVLPFN